MLPTYYSFAAAICCYDCSMLSLACGSNFIVMSPDDHNVAVRLLSDVHTMWYPNTQLNIVLKCVTTLGVQTDMCAVFLRCVVSAPMMCPLR